MNTLYIDGGGTKTAVYLVNDSNIIKKTIYDQCNVNNDFNGSSKIIYKIINDHNGLFEKVICGIAGYDSNKKKVDGLKKEILIKTKKEIYFYNDVELLAILYFKKTNINNFTVLNLGTGTLCLNFKNKEFRKILGWGKVVGDIGSGYDIGINFLRYLALCEDKQDYNCLYKKFIKQFNINNIREYIPLINNVKFVNKITNWLVMQGSDVVNEFVIPRVKKTIDYISFLNEENFVFTGSVLIKNEEVRKFLSKYLNDKKISYITLDKLLEYKN